MAAGVLHVLVLAMILSAQVISTFSQFCPSGEYVHCASKNQYCIISDTVDEGYMSYGRDGRWVLVPFTNAKTDGTQLRIKCDYPHGDIAPGVEKHCCYVAAGTGFTQDTYSAYYAEGATVDFGSHKERAYGVRYGADSRFLYRVISGATLHCNYRFFSDHVVGVSKFCNIGTATGDDSVPAAIPEPTSKKWTMCGNQNEQCTGLDKSVAQWVRYGSNSQYYLRLVISAADGQIPCGNALFGDPRPGFAKFCWRSPAEYTFTNIVGQWTKLQSCLGCAENQYRKMVGVTDLTETEITDTWSWSLTTTVSAGFELKAMSASTSVSSTIANSVANRMLTSISKTVEEESTFTCAKDILYQWTLGADQNNGVSSETFTVKGEDLACMDNPLEPKCPPGYCTDDDCQLPCTHSLEASPSVFKFNPGGSGNGNGNGGQGDEEHHDKEYYYLPAAYLKWAILFVVVMALVLAVNAVYICVSITSKCREGKKCGGTAYGPVKILEDAEDALNANKL